MGGHRYVLRVISDHGDKGAVMSFMSIFKVEGRWEGYFTFPKNYNCGIFLNVPILDYAY